MSKAGKSPTTVLREQLPQVRARLNDLSAQDLAARIEAIGGSLDRVAISKIETGKRGVSLDEALQLAVALGVAPLHLFLPRDDAAGVALAPEVDVSAVAARAWVRGQEALPGASEKVFRTEVPDSEWQQSRQMSEREKEARAAWDRARRQLRVAETLMQMRKDELDQLEALGQKWTLDMTSLASATPRQVLTREAQRIEDKLDRSEADVAEARVEEAEARERYLAVARSDTTELRAEPEE